MLPLTGLFLPILSLPLWPQTPYKSYVLVDFAKMISLGFSSQGQETRSNLQLIAVRAILPAFAVDMLAKAENALGRYQTFRFVSFLLFNEVLPLPPLLPLPLLLPLPPLPPLLPLLPLMPMLPMLPLLPLMPLLRLLSHSLNLSTDLDEAKNVASRVRWGLGPIP